MNPAWNSYDRHKVAELLLQQFPHLSIDKLLAAIRDCDKAVQRAAGWDELAKCTKEHLERTGGTGEP